MQKRIIASVVIGDVIAWIITYLLARVMSKTEFGKQAYRTLAGEIYQEMARKKNVG